MIEIVSFAGCFRHCLVVDGHRLLPVGFGVYKLLHSQDPFSFHQPFCFIERRALFHRFDSILVNSTSNFHLAREERNMSSPIKSIVVYGKGGPNPTKVTIMLEELGVPYEVNPIPLADIKKPEYLAINPNGRLPSIHDPNTDVTLWESGAIFEYLIERYDTAHKFSFAPGTAESYHAKQWLFFQVSGQGPYYGQAAWFKKFHQEQLPSAIDRYVNEVNRVTGVLEGHLAKQKVKAGSDGPWLVGGKLSYVDIAFMPWQKLITLALTAEEYTVDNFTFVKEWLGKLSARESVEKVIGDTFKPMN
jgi:glutathione S-transferase